jgi:hypothetical protein
MSREIAGSLVALISLQLATFPGAITGSVIKAGTAIRQALQNARVELNGPGGTLVARTDVNGRFAFSNLPPGDYRIDVTRDGFIRDRYRKRLVLAGGQPGPDILFELEAAPIAAGRVLDTYGEPLPNVLIEALRRSYDVRGNPRLTRVATTLSGDRGEYRILWLDPGDYFFYAASPPPDPSDTQPPPPVAPTFFPGVNTPEEAKSLRLDVGREVRVDFRLRAAALWPVSGHAMHGVTGRALAASITLIPPGGDPNLSQYHAQSSANGPLAGEFSIDRIPPGTYYIMAKSGSGDPETTAIQRIELRPVLIAPRSGYTLTLQLSPPLPVSGRLYLEGRSASDARGARVGLIAVDPDLPSPQETFAQTDGAFLINGVAPGSYLLEMSNLPQDFYVKAARYGEDDALDKPVTVAAKEPPKPLQILVGVDGGRLQVTARAGTQVVLVPDMARRSRREQYRTAAAGDDGQTLLRGIPPGSYKVFAWERVEPNAYLNADFLQLYEQSGTSVRITSGENQGIKARVIARE